MSLYNCYHKCYYSKTMVNVGDLSIETSFNWIVVALFLLFSASVLMRITAPIYLALN